MAKAKNIQAVQPAQETLVLEREENKEPKKYVIILHNDDFTTQEFVIFVLMTFFHKDQADARTLMLKVHLEGKARVGLFTKDIALSKVASISSFSRQNGMPLKVTAESA
jgi:ATP-dependent Clp protease adaptor protein ClpS